MNPPSNTQSNALILGGGPAGAAIATLLSRAGRHVTLLEQHAVPHHKVCGEFLSAEALHYLATLGLHRAALEKLGALPITHVRLARRTVLAQAALPFAALSLTRRTLDEALLILAQQSGAQLHRGHRIDTLTCTASGWQATLANSEAHTATAAFLCTGKHDLRAHPRPPGRQPNLIAFKQYFRLTPEQSAHLKNHVELILYPGGYAGLQPVEDNIANLCLLIHRDTYQKLGATWPALLHHITSHSPHLATRLTSATPLLEKPLALSHIPYGFLRTAPIAENLWSLGDQTAVIPSFSGDGMSIALHSAHLAAALYLNGRSPRDLTTQLQTQLRRPITLATHISRALIHPATQPLAALAPRLLPTLLPRLAQATRIPANSLL